MKSILTKYCLNCAGNRFRLLQDRREMAHFLLRQIACEGRHAVGAPHFAVIQQQRIDFSQYRRRKILRLQERNAVKQVVVSHHKAQNALLGQRAAQI